MFEKIPFPKQNPLQVELYFSETVNSRSENYRSVIRDHLFKHFFEKGLEPHPELKDLTILPKQSGYAISLSHCAKASAFVIGADGHPLGVDIEEIDRIKPSVIDRISSHEERQLSPQKEFLFPSKEATWKAINKLHGLQTISEITISNWTMISESQYLFKAAIFHQQVKGDGALLKKGPLLISVFQCHP